MPFEMEACLLVIPKTETLLQKEHSQLPPMTKQMWGCIPGESRTPTRTNAIGAQFRLRFSSHHIMFSLIVSGIGIGFLCFIGISGIVSYFVQYSRQVRHQDSWSRNCISKAAALLISRTENVSNQLWPIRTTPYRKRCLWIQLNNRVKTLGQNTLRHKYKHLKD